VADLALGDQLGEGADRFLDRRLRVHPVLVVQVDVVGAEPAERALNCDPDVRRAAVHALAACVGHEPELGRQDDLVAAALDGTADKLLIGVGAVDLRGVDHGDAEVECPVDCADGLGVVGAGAGVGSGHAHRPEADTADIEAPQRCVLHGPLPFELPEVDQRCVRPNSCMYSCHHGLKTGQAGVGHRA
jgi:hypothetical protein